MPAKSKTSVVSGLCLWLVVCGLALLSSCGPSAAYRQGSAAAEAGDWVSAVRAFRAAVAEDPDDEDAVAQLAAAEEALVQSTTSLVAAQVAFQDFPGALSTIAPALELMPQDPRLLGSLEHIRASGVAYHRDLIDRARYRDAFEGASALAQSFPYDSQVGALVRDARDAYADEIRDRALRAESDGSRGAALASWTALWDLTGSSEAAQHAEPLRDAIAEESRWTYQIALDGDWAPGAMPVLSGALTELVSDDKEALTRLVASLSPPSFQESYRSSIASQSYLAGYEEVLNPAYANAEQHVEMQQRDVLRAEQRVLDAERDVHEAEVRRDRYQGEDEYERYYDEWDDEVEDLQRARESLQRERQRLFDLRAELRRTPPTITQEVWADYRYEVRDYTLMATADLDAWLYGSRGLVREVHDTPFAETTDRTHDAHPTISLPADPLAYPVDEETLGQMVRARAVERLEELLWEQFEVYRQSFESNGLGMTQSLPGQAADLLAAYVLLRPDQVSPEVAGWLDRSFGLTDPALMAALQ